VLQPSTLPISIVISTCNRRQRLLSLLKNLDQLVYPVVETIIVDSGEDRLSPEQYTSFPKLKIQYLSSAKSVCIQRNTGIRQAQSPWIFLCDDDIEIPPDYFDVFAAHITSHPDTGAVSGQWLQKENDKWIAFYPLQSPRTLLWKYIFQLGIWGEISCPANNYWIKRIKRYYKKKGNHISKAGWPVNTDFSSEFYTCPVYSLGASLVKKEWLVNSPYDEVLDRYGIGDNYGVIAGFPLAGVQVLKNTVVYHHREPTNRLKTSLQYYRRLLALDYFIRTKPALKYIKRSWLLWSLSGNLLVFLYKRQGLISKATIKAMTTIAFGENPYSKALDAGQKVTEPNF